MTFLRETIMPHSPLISGIILVTGNYAQVYQLVEKLVCDIQNTYLTYAHQVELVIVVQNQTWLRSMAFDSLLDLNVSIVEASLKEELPAILFNTGALTGQKGRFLSFAWPGIDFPSWMRCLATMSEHLTTLENPQFLASNPAFNNGQTNALQSWKQSNADKLPAGYPVGWLEMQDYVPMAGSLIARDLFMAQGGFSCVPLLQKGFWWAFTVKSARNTAIHHIDTASPAENWCWDSYPLKNNLTISGDLIARYVVRKNTHPDTIMTQPDWDSLEHFLVDLPTASQKHIKTRISEWLPNDTMYHWQKTKHNSHNPSLNNDPLRVVVLGGLNEPAHNQLCFFNYFSLLEGQGTLSWRTILDTAAQSSDLIKADLVIFSRIKSSQGCRLMDFCVQHHIPTLYMLDDNWFSVGRDWVEYETILSPGTPLFESFMYCLKKANQVITYNKILAQDLRPHCQQLTIFPTNIDLSLFPKGIRAPQRKLRVGYVGSIRYEFSAFLALIELAKEREDFDILIMSPTLYPGFKEIETNRVIFQPYLFGYSHYAKVLCNHIPDILLAPLGHTRTEASKCPNKYLEITAAGAVGIYSNTSPYDYFIQHKNNGLLVKNDISSWKAAMTTLLDNHTLRSEILANAEQEVHQKFNTPHILPDFLAFLRQTSQRENKQKETV